MSVHEGVIVWWRDLQSSHFLESRELRKAALRWSAFRLTRRERPTMEAVAVHVSCRLSDLGIATIFERAPELAPRDSRRPNSSRPQITWTGPTHTVWFQIDHMPGWFTGHNVYVNATTPSGEHSHTVARDICNLRELAEAFAAAVADPGVKWIAGKGPTKDPHEWIAAHSD